MRVEQSGLHALGHVLVMSFVFGVSCVGCPFFVSVRLLSLSPGGVITGVATHTLAGRTL